MTTETTRPADAPTFEGTFGRSVTVRAASGMAHRAWMQRDNGRFLMACSCPGSNNGRLANRVRFVAEGWEKSTCGKKI